MKIKQDINTAMLDTIRGAVETVTGLDLFKKTRQVEYVQARSLFYKFARDNKQTLQNIGRYLKKDHASVMHSLRKYEQDVQYNKSFRALHNQVKEILGSLDIKSVKDATNTLLEAYELRNTILIRENMELRAELASYKNTDKSIDGMLNDVPEDRKQSFIDNQLKTFLLLERSKLETEAEREAQALKDRKEKEEYRRMAIFEEGGRVDDGKKHYYMSLNM